MRPPAAPTGSPPPDDRLRLVILYGGRSAEHEISCISARHVLAACDPQRYQVKVVGITTGGGWVDADMAVADLDPSSPALPEPDLLAAGGATPVDPFAAVGDRALSSRTVVWPVLHGPMGEDGTVQGLLELAGVAYVGAGVAGSAAAMDKALAKTVFAGAGLPQARWFELGHSQLGYPPDEVAARAAKAVEAELGWPVYVKPANMGSTIGVSRASDLAELETAVALATRYDDHVVVEEAIVGRELEMGILGMDPIRVSGVGEIVPSHDFYDFEDKYHSGTADLRIPAPVSDDVAEEMGLIAVAACRALRVESMARVDFFYEEDSGRLLLNEVNTLPGFTPISMYPRLWRAAGISYPALVDELVAQARSRHARRAGLSAQR